MRSYWPGSLLYASRWVASGRSRQNNVWERRGALAAAGSRRRNAWQPQVASEARRWRRRGRDRRCDVTRSGSVTGTSTLDVQELGAERFEVMVGGETYDVTLSGDEELPDATITPAVTPGRAANARTTAKPADRAACRRQLAAPRPPLAPRRVAAAGGSSLNAPMPGVILDVVGRGGDTVERGQPVATLEAMKMNNVIKSPRAGDDRRGLRRRGPGRRPRRPDRPLQGGLAR